MEHFIAVVVVSKLLTATRLAKASVPLQGAQTCSMMLNPGIQSVTGIKKTGLVEAGAFS